MSAQQNDCIAAISCAKRGEFAEALWWLKQAYSEYGEPSDVDEAQDEVEELAATANVDLDAVESRSPFK